MGKSQSYNIFQCEFDFYFLLIKFNEINKMA